MEKINQVVIYTDGACNPNPGAGGYAAILLAGNSKREICGAVHHTTNNRMELMAAIAALEALRWSCQVTLYSDSRYLVDAIQRGWVVRWKRNQWLRGRNRPVANVDLWTRLLSVCAKHSVTFVWVQGHAGNVHNNRCDRLSVRMSKSIRTKRKRTRPNSKRKQVSKTNSSTL